MLKVIEVLQESTKSWEDAAQQAVAQADKSVRNVKSIYIENFQATVEGGQIKGRKALGQGPQGKALLPEAAPDLQPGREPAQVVGQS